MRVGRSSSSDLLVRAPSGGSTEPIAFTPTRGVETEPLRRGETESSTLGASRLLAQPSAARRELLGHLAELGISAPPKSPIDAIASAELAKGRALDARVTRAQMDRAMQRADAARKLLPAPQTNLFGFTRLIDAKLALTPAVVGALAERALDRRKGASPKGDAEALLRAIDSGPPDGATAWKRPTSKIELVASIVRHLVLGRGASLQLVLSPEQLSWLEDVLRERSIDLKIAMGGAGGFTANLASALPGVASHFYSADPLPERVLERFSPSVRGIGPGGESRALKQSKSSESVARVNVAAEYLPSRFEILGKSKLRVGGKEVELSSTARGRIILGTPGKDRATFGELPEVAIRKIAKDHDLVFLAGPHHLTSAPPGTCPGADELAQQLDVLGKANPRIVRHFQYVVPKVAQNEPILLGALRGKFESMSLNSVELPGLVQRLHDGQLAEHPPADPDPPREVAEQPATMLSGAIELRAAMQLSRLHIHGFQGDLLIVSGPVDPERQTLALLRARQLASMKAANESGEIKSASDLWPVAPVVQGIGLAGLHAFADAVASRFGLSPTERDKVVERWWFKHERTNTTFVFAPTRGIHESTGGTISLGDVIDSSALIFGAEDKGRGKKLHHPSSFRIDSSG
ncbi:MAG: hypothetical protein HY791_32265 [Deltaproteobacteria bacterium]|nr:hypothetical protein [Deltaproteobacteria bacterium]